MTGVEPGSGSRAGGRRRRPYYRSIRADNRTAGEGRAAASFMRHVQRRAGECHIVARTAEQDKVRELQRTLYRAAKAGPGRRFDALHNKVYRRDVLERAWELLRADRGAAGIDRQTIADVKEYGVDRLVDELAADLKAGRWRPLPGRRVFIPKPLELVGDRFGQLPAGRRSAGNCRFLRSVTVLCWRQRGSSSSRSSRPTCLNARSGFDPGARRTTLFRCSLMRRGGGGGGWPSRTWFAPRPRLPHRAFASPSCCFQRCRERPSARSRTSFSLSAPTRADTLESAKVGYASTRTGLLSVWWARRKPQSAEVASGAVTGIASLARSDRVAERRRAVALARHFREAEGLSVAQVADRLGRSPATIKAYFYDPTGRRHVR